MDGSLGTGIICTGFKGSEAEVNSRSHCEPAGLTINMHSPSGRCKSWTGPQTRPSSLFVQPLSTLPPGTAITISCMPWHNGKSPSTFTEPSFTVTCCVYVNAPDVPPENAPSILQAPW